MLACAGCQERQPLNQSMAVAIADHYQRYQSVNWGDPIEVLAPGEPDAKGHTWWQVRYAPGTDGARRMILVDDASDWARFPDADYVERTPPRSRTDAAHPLQVEPGPWVLRLTPPSTLAGDERVRLEREAIRLNTLAGQTGLVPLFSLHTDANQQSALIYGWQADRGIAQDPAVVDWVQRRTAYNQTEWIRSATDATNPTKKL